MKPLCCHINFKNLSGGALYFGSVRTYNFAPLINPQNRFFPLNNPLFPFVLCVKASIRLASARRLALTTSTHNPPTPQRGWGFFFSFRENSI